jgi:integrase
MAERYGPFVDALLSAKAIVADEDSRWALIEEVGRALTQAAQKLKRNAEGDYAPDPIAKRFPAPWQPPQASNGATSGAEVSLTALVEQWWVEQKAAGRKESTYESYRNTIAAFVRYLGHDEAARVTKGDVVGFKHFRLASTHPRTGRPIKPKTVKDSDLAGLKTILGWAVRNGKLPTNAAEGVTIRLGKPQKLRSKGFTETEALAILAAALAHKRGANEAPGTFAAKLWVPWLSAYTGARVGELAQLRKEDVRREGKHWVIKITPEAGTVKTNEARDVVLQSISRAVGRGVVPELVDQLVAGDDSIRTHEQEREQCSLSRTTERERAASVDDLERSEDPEVHASRTTLAPFLLSRNSARPQPASYR